MTDFKKLLSHPVTGYFLSPVLGMKLGGEKGFVRYAHRLKEGDKYLDEGQYLYVLFKGDSVPDKCLMHPLLDNVIEKGEFRILRFRLPQDVVDNVIPLFMQGKYSKFPKEYLDKYLSEDTQFMGNRMIIEKDPTFKAELEEFLGMSIDDDLELWDKYRPDKESLDIARIAVMPEA